MQQLLQARHWLLKDILGLRGAAAAAETLASARFMYDNVGAVFLLKG